MFMQVLSDNNCYNCDNCFSRLIYACVETSVCSEKGQILLCYLLFIFVFLESYVYNFLSPQSANRAIFLLGEGWELELNCFILVNLFQGHKHEVLDLRPFLFVMPLGLSNQRSVLEVTVFFLFLF